MELDFLKKVVGTSPFYMMMMMVMIFVDMSV